MHIIKVYEIKIHFYKQFFLFNLLKNMIHKEWKEEQQQQLQQKNASLVCLYSLHLNIFH